MRIMSIFRAEITQSIRIGRLNRIVSIKYRIDLKSIHKLLNVIFPFLVTIGGIDDGSHRGKGINHHRESIRSTLYNYYSHKLRHILRKDICDRFPFFEGRNL